MDYLLDANAGIVYLNGRSLALKQRLESHRRENILFITLLGESNDFKDLDLIPDGGG